MGKAVGIGICILGVVILLCPWLYAYGREWLAVRAGRDRDLEHRDFDDFDWAWMIGRCGLFGLSLIASGVSIFLKY
jgi:hypothetical protein